MLIFVLFGVSVCFACLLVFVACVDFANFICACYVMMFSCCVWVGLMIVGVICYLFVACLFALVAGLLLIVGISLILV